MTNDNLWIYIERTISRGKLIKFGRNYLKKNNVLVLEFDNYGILARKEFYNKNKAIRIINHEGGIYGNTQTFNDKYHRETFFVSAHTRNLAKHVAITEQTGTSIGQSSSY